MAWQTLVTLIIITTFSKTQSQQEYVNNKQLDCENTYNSTLGNICNSIPSCQSYLTFKSTPQFNTPSSISHLLNSSPSLISQSNNISTVQTLPTDTIITVPINCTCSNNNTYYQYNTSYTIQNTGETYLIVANNTYQALSTCQALIAQNPYNERNLVRGNNLTVPLRCACPTKKQSDEGFKYLLTYLVSEGESVSSIAEIFNVDPQSVNEANKLSSTSFIFYFTPLLIPLKNEPPPKIVKPASPPESPPPPPPVENGGSSSSTKWVIIGVVVGVVVLLLVGVALFFLCFRRRRQQKLQPPAVGKAFSDSDTKKVSEITSTSQSWSLSSEGIRYAVDSLTVYKYEDLQNATNFFSEENKIKGSVYRASFKGDDAAVKILKGDVSSEINILKRINHANIIRLSGFCVYKGNTYLVYEFAENNSLDDWLHSEKNKDKNYSNSMCLSWFQRVQIAHDVADALNYLHNYANPPHVHKNLKSGNILLDGKFRGKVSNFGLARVMENEGGDEGFQLTRHVIGTQGYMAPEYIENGLITPKMDVFAFGVVILELLSGREVVGSDKSNGLGDQLLASTVNQVLEGDNVREKLRGFMDPNLRDEYPLDLAFSMAEIAKRCVARDLNSRPNVSEVFMILSKIQSSTLEWGPSGDLERSRSVSQVSDSR